MRIGRLSGPAIPKLTRVLAWAFAGCLTFPFSRFPDSLHQPDSHLPTQINAFLNGRWLSGQGFLSKPMYSVNGIFTHSEPDRVKKTIDWKNGYVVPPFGEAHTHHVEGDWNIAIKKSAPL